MMYGLTDIHCHIVPNVDDGSKSLEESLQMLRMEQSDGVSRLILTPHFRYDMFETPLETVRKQFEMVREAAAAELPGLALYLGCELHSSMDMVDCLRRKERLTLAGSSYVLVEFSGADKRPYIKERLQKLKLSGFRPIVAHVERYPDVIRDLDFIDEMRENGVSFQVNADTISGKDGFGMKRFAKKLMKEDLLDFVGSDGHGAKERIPAMGKAYAQVCRTMGESYARRIFEENPSKVLG